MNNSVIEHRACYYYVPLREEYLCLCKGDHCQALILAVLEEWMNTKRGKGQALYTYMTYPQWVNALYGLYGRNLIILALNALEKEELISKRAYRLRGKDTFEYILNTEEMNKRMKELPEKAPHETLPNINAFKNQRVQKSTRLQEDGNGVEKSTPEGQDAFKKGRNIESITQITHNTDYERESAHTSQTPDALSPDALAQVTTSSLSLASLQEALVQLSEQERTALLAQYGLPAHSQAEARDAHTLDNIASAPNLGGVVRCLPESEPEPEPESEPPDTVSKARRSGVVATRLPPALRDLSETQDARRSAPTHIPVATETATSIQGAPAASQSDTAFSLPGDTSWVPGAHQAVQKDEQTGETAAMNQDALPLPLAEGETAHAPASSRAEGRRRRRSEASHTENQQETPSPPPEEMEREEQLQARCRALYTKIRQWRGYPLEKRGAIINERKCIRTLVERYTDEQIEQIRWYLFSKHWKHSKPDNRYKIGANEILDEAGSVLQELRHGYTATGTEGKILSYGHPRPPGMPSAPEKPKRFPTYEELRHSKEGI